MTKLCRICKQSFQTTNPRRMYCASCRKIAERRWKRRWWHKHRPLPVSTKNDAGAVRVALRMKSCEHSEPPCFACLFRAAAKHISAPLAVQPADLSSSLFVWHDGRQVCLGSNPPAHYDGLVIEARYVNATLLRRLLRAVRITHREAKRQLRNDARSTTNTDCAQQPSARAS